MTDSKTQPRKRCTPSHAALASDTLVCWHAGTLARYTSAATLGAGVGAGAGAVAVARRSDLPPPPRPSTERLGWPDARDDAGVMAAWLGQPR